MKKIALETNMAEDGMTYYAEDHTFELNDAPAENSHDSLMFLFDDDEDAPKQLEAHNEKDHSDDKDGKEEEEPLIVLDEFDDEKDPDADDSETDASTESADDDDQDGDEDMAFDGLVNQSQDILPGVGFAIIKKEEEPARDTTWEEDGDHSKYLAHAIKRLQSIPPHSGQTTVGCEKAITYLRSCDKEISSAFQSDTKNQIDEVKAEALRDTIHKWIAQLEEARDNLMGKKHKSKKKKASFVIGKKVVARLNDGQDLQYFISVANEGEERLLKVEMSEPDAKQVQAFVSGQKKGITKEAEFTTFVDPFLESITRILIRSHITQGKDLREVFARLNDQYDFTAREKLSIHELLRVSGLGMNFDLGRLNEKDPVLPSDGKNIEYVTEYFA